MYNVTKIAGLAAAALLALTAAGTAADLRRAPAPAPIAVAPPPPPLALAYNWSGLYLGGQLGAGWSRTTLTGAGDTHFFNFVGDERVITDTAFLGGAFVGAQMQAGAWVFGIEGGAAWGKLEDTVQATGPFATDNYFARVKDLYSISGRLGWAAGATLLYAKGGWATAEVSEQSDEIPAFNHFAATKERHNGYVLGAGLDYALMPNVIAGVEYDFYDLGKKNHSTTANAAPTAYSVDVRPIVHTVMARLSFKTP